METKEEFQEKSKVLVEPVNWFIAENEWQHGLPIKSNIAWDRQEQQVVVQLEYKDRAWVWEAKTIEQMKEYIMSDMLNLVQL